MNFYKDIFTNNLRKISDKIFSISDRFPFVFNEKERKIALNKIEFECMEKALNEERRINEKKVVFQERIKTLHQIINLKSKINQIWLELQKNPLVASELQRFVDATKTDFGITSDDLNNMNIDYHFIYFSSLIHNAISNNEKPKRIIIKNNFKKHNILPWDSRLKNTELPNFLPTGDSLAMLQNVLRKFEQFKKKITKLQNKRILTETFDNFIKNELKADSDNTMKIQLPKENAILTSPILNALRFLQDEKVLKVTSVKNNRKRLIPKKLNSKRLNKDILNIRFDPKRLTGEINQSVLILLARQK